MNVTTHKNLILVFHRGNGEKTAGEQTTGAMRAAAKTLRQQYKTIAIYHDATDLQAADNDYMLAFAALAKEMGKEGYLYVATIPAAWVRVLAKTASYLGGIETHFFKTPDESAAFLVKNGFEFPAEAKLSA